MSDRETLLREAMMSGQLYSPAGSPGIFPGIRKYEMKTDTERMDEIVEKIGRETLFRWTYVPMVVCDIMWDYLDTVHDISVSNRVEKLKKPFRELRQIKSDMDYEKGRYIRGKFLEREMENSEQLYDNMKEVFNEIYLDAVNAEDDNLDDKWLKGGLIIAYALYKAVYFYTEEYRKIIKEKLGKDSRNVMHKRFFDLDSVLKGVCQDFCPENLGNIYGWSQRILSEMHDIVIFDDEEAEKTIG